LSTASITPADVEEHIRAIFEVRNSLDPDRITELDTGGYGFGYRTRDPRPPYSSKKAYREALELWLASIVSFRIEIDEIHTAVDGDVGMAWGLYHEKFRPRGGETEVVHGRFTEIMRRDANGWRTLFYHRDATPFDSQGVYAPAKDGR
jgi:SnoaL-like domain